MPVQVFHEYHWGLSQGKEFQQILGEQQKGGHGQYIAPSALLKDLFLRVE